MNEHLFTGLIEHQPEGEYLVSVPALSARILELTGTRLKVRDTLGRVQALRDELGLSGLAQLLDVGEPTLANILDGLAHPGHNPRDDLPSPLLRQDSLQMEDLQVGVRLRGTVRNVADCGASIDIGVKQDGLVHIFKMADHDVRDTFAVVSVGDIVDVTVISADLERGRIGLRLQE